MHENISSRRPHLVVAALRVAGPYNTRASHANNLAAVLKGRHGAGVTGAVAVLCGVHRIHQIRGLDTWVACTLTLLGVILWGHLFQKSVGLPSVQ